MSDNRTQAIEARIDREVSGAIAFRASPGNQMAIAPTNMGELFEFAKMMAVSGSCIPKEFRNNPGGCLAIALQAFRTGGDPFAVANKAFLVNDRIAYEAQYIHAIINTSGLLKKRLRPVYSGEGLTRRCMIYGEVVGEDEPLEYESPTVGAIPVKNSPLWKNDPDQQLFYYASRAWARRHLPEVALGMYTRDDIESEPIDITPPPRPQREDFVEHETADEPEKAYAFADRFGELHEFEDAGVAAIAFQDVLGAATTLAELEASWENGAAMVKEMIACGARRTADEIIETHHRHLLALKRGSAGVSPAADDGMGDADNSSAGPPAEPGLMVRARKAAGEGTNALRAFLKAATASECRSLLPFLGTLQEPGDLLKVARDMDLIRNQPQAGRPPEQNGSPPAPADATAPRDAFWSQEKFVVPGATPQEIVYYLGHHLRQALDQLDVNGIELDSAEKLAALPKSYREQAAAMIEARRREVVGDGD